MDPDTNSLPSLPEMARPLMADLAASVLNAIEANVIGIYLGGSIATGGFDDTTSNLSFLVVTKEPLSEAAVAQLTDAHNAIRISEKNRLYRDYEGDYITLKDAQNPLSDDIVALHVNMNGYIHEGAKGPEFVIDLWKIRRSGFTIYGPAPEAIIGEITIDNLLAAERATFGLWWLPILENRQPMDAQQQAFTVITMARILYGLERHDSVSKEKAATWLAAAQPQFKDLIAQALAWREGTVIHAQEEVYDLMQYVATRVASDERR